MISRRSFLAGTAGAALFAPRLALGQGAKLKLSHYLPPMHQMHVWLTGWADSLREKSGGEVDIEIFPSSQMGPAGRQFDLVRTGVADIGFFFPALTPGRFPLSDVHLMSFAYAKPDTLKPIKAGAASELATGLFDAYSSDYAGTKPLIAVVTPGGGFFMKEKLIQKVADVSGMRLRPTGPILASYVEAWGGSNAAFPPAEVADAIAKGTIDGAMFSFEAARAFQFGNVVKKISMLPASTGLFVLTMNADSYARLSPKARELVDASTGSQAARAVGELYAAAEDAGRAYMEQSGAEIVDLDIEAAGAFKALSDAVMEKDLAALEGRGLAARALDAAIRDKVANA
jgi:TRAP-type C4-dicarboxylate transport system substrate-binding protein